MCLSGENRMRRGVEGGVRRRLRIRELELQSEGDGEGNASFVGFSSAAPAIPSPFSAGVLRVGCSCSLPPCALHLNEPQAAHSRGEGAP